MGSSSQKQDTTLNGDVLHIDLPAMEQPARLDKVLALNVPEALGLSRSRIAELIRNGAVKVSGEVIKRPSEPVKGEQALHLILPPPEPSSLAPEKLPLEILFEDEELIVLNKAAGIVVHPAPGARNGTLVNALLAHCGESLLKAGADGRPGIVHRLDKDTSGLMVVAKTSFAHQHLAAQFAARSIQRHYLALAHGVFECIAPKLARLKGISLEEGGVLRLEAPIGRHPRDRLRQDVRWEEGKRAITRVSVLQRFGAPEALSFIKCKLETGRTHQIRVHMAYLGFPLLGDQLYSRGRILPAKSFNHNSLEVLSSFSRQALHAAELGFKHPRSGKHLSFETPPADDFAQLLLTLQP